MRRLFLVTPQGHIRNVKLSHSPVTPGRTPDNSLSFPEDDGLSRHHLVLEELNGAWTVRDLDSKNGTLVNDKPIRISRAGGGLNWVFVRAGRELAQHRPLPELFSIILDLPLEAVAGERARTADTRRGRASRGAGLARRRYSDSLPRCGTRF